MNASTIAHTLERVIRDELDGCERAIKNNDSPKALSELDEAARKLKQIVHEMRRLGDET